MSKFNFFFLLLILFYSQQLISQTIDNNKKNRIKNETPHTFNNRVFINPLRVKVKVFPEEVTSFLYFRIAGNANNSAHLRLADSGGKIYFNHSVQIGQTQKIFVNNLPRGTYSVYVSIGGIVISNQVVIFI